MSTEHNHPSDNFDGFLDVSRYDLLLAALPMPLFVGALVGRATAAPFVDGLGAGALLAALLLAYGLFVDPPV
ncbi:MAG: hypothetical protein ABEH90_07835 [Halolamina sp.]